MSNTLVGSPPPQLLSTTWVFPKKIPGTNPKMDGLFKKKWENPSVFWMIWGGKTTHQFSETLTFWLTRTSQPPSSGHLPGFGPSLCRSRRAEQLLGRSLKGWLLAGWQVGIMKQLNGGWRCFSLEVYT